MSLTLLDYLERRGWEGRPSRGSWIGTCPIHVDRKPSFAIYDEGEKQWWKCFHEDRTGDVIAMINILEQGDTDTKVAWHEAFKRYADLGGRVEELSPLARHTKVERPGATQVQKAMMTEAMHYWHEQLWLRQSYRGRDYLQARGVSVTDIRLYQQIGYAPPTTRQVYSEFSTRMRSAIGLDWECTAKELGLLSEKTGRLGIWDRVMFCSLDEESQCTYYQGRRVQPIKEERVPFAHMGTRLVSKYPFSLPVPRPTKDLFVHVESAFGSTILATYGFRSGATQGSPPPDLVKFMTKKEELHIVATDKDVAHHYQDGRDFYPGEAHAKKIIRMLDDQKREWKRITPPAQYKDLDAWVREKGIDPFLQQVG